MTKHKILYYSSHPTHDTSSEVGYATHQRETIEALRELGHDVINVNMGDIGMRGEDSAYTSGNKKGGIKEVIKALVPKFFWISLKDFKLLLHDKRAGDVLEKAVLEHKPDFIYERNEILQDSGLKVAKKHSIKYFLEVNAPFPEEMVKLEGRSFFHWFSPSMEKRKYQYASKIFVVSTALRTYLKNKFGTDTSKILLAPNRITPSKFYRLEGRNEVKTFGFVGSILPHHKVELLIRAFSKLKRQNSELTLRIIGDGAQREELEELTSKLDILDSVIFVGKVPNDKVIEELNLMDVCVMPGTNWYGSPVKVFEYGAACKAIIAPNQIPLLDVMTSGKDGLLSEENEEALYEAMLYMVEHPEESRAMAETFHQKVLNQYTWLHAAKEIVSAHETE